MSNFPIVNAAVVNPVNANAQQQAVNGVMAALGSAAKFADDFEDAFVFGKSGSLKVDQEHMDKMEAFVMWGVKGVNRDGVNTLVDPNNTGTLEWDTMFFSNSELERIVC